MNYLKNSIQIICFLLISQNLIGQESPVNQQEIGIQFGLSFAQIDEARFSSITKKPTLAKAGLILKKIKNNHRQEINFAFSTNMTKTVSGLRYKVINPDFSYSYQRKVKDNWIGAYFQNATLLLTPQTKRSLFNNNPISYTITSSLGLQFNGGQTVYDQNNHKILMDYSLRTSLLNHVVRPAYAHPYPDEYLKEDVFHPTRSGMSKTIMKSGKLQTVDRYQSLQVVLGFSYIHNSKTKLGIQYAMQMQNVSTDKKIRYLTNDIMITVSRLY